LAAGAAARALAQPISGTAITPSVDRLKPCWIKFLRDTMVLLGE
jgi:hypothetical protein